MVELVDDLIDYDDGKLASGTHDAEAAAALETVDDAIPDLPVLKKGELAPGWQASTPVLCVAGRGPLDEAVAIMLAQLLEKHAIGARAEGADAVAIANIARLETSGVVMVCLSYLDASSRAHMRYTIRRMRRKLPNAQILLGCWTADIDPTTLLETTKPDAVAPTPQGCSETRLEAADNTAGSSLPTEAQPPGVSVDAV